MHAYGRVYGYFKVFFRHVASFEWYWVCTFGALIIVVVVIIVKKKKDYISYNIEVNLIKMEI